MNKTKKTALLGILVALAMILSYIDSIIPLLPAVPGVRLGLANAVSVFLLYSYSAPAALAVTAVRVILTGVLFYGNVYHIAYGLSGALLAFAVMLLLKRTGRFSETGVSIAGGVCHNTGQVCCAVLLTSTPEIFSYLPVLFISGAVSGACIGLVSSIIIKRVKLT